MAVESSKKGASYYYEVGGAEHGPVDGAALTRLAKVGTIAAGTPIWTEAMPVKVAAHKLPFLAPHLKRPANRTGALVAGGLTAAAGLGVLAAFLWMVPSAAARESASACRGLSGFERPRPQICPDGDKTCSLPLPAPDFTAVDHQGKPVKLSDFRGKVVLLNFWASWCGTCKIEKEGLAEMARELGSSSFEVITLASDSEWSKVLTSTVQALKPYATPPASGPDGIPFASALEWYQRELPEGVPFQVFLDPPKGDDTIGVIARSWGLDKVPESALIDRNGVIRAYFVNKRDWSSSVAQTCIRAVLDE